MLSQCILECVPECCPRSRTVFVSVFDAAWDSALPISTEVSLLLRSATLTISDRSVPSISGAGPGLLDSIGSVSKQRQISVVKMTEMPCTGKYDWRHSIQDNSQL